MATKQIDEIIEALAQHSQVRDAKVLEWMQSDDIELQAAIVTLLSEHSSLVQPPLPGRDVFDFCLSYFRRCLLENPPEGEFTNNRTVEGFTLQNWFRQLWWNRDANSVLIDTIKRTITEVYKSGDERTKYTVETAILEHLFEELDIEAYFSDWKRDPDLTGAYERAHEWGRAHRS